MMSLRRNRARLDVLIIGLLILPIFIAAVYFDAFDLVAGFAIEHEPLDEALLAIPVVGLLGFVYGLRRIADLRQEVTRRREAELRFDAAINNMSQGLCLFDRDRKLVVSNKRYADIYNLPPELLKPGTRLEEILDHRIRHGNHPLQGVEAYIRRRIELVTNDRQDSDSVELQDGRTIFVMHHPMADGGWVSTHDDVTEQRRTEARIQHLARHDALTDLPNRILFREHLDEVSGRIRRGDTVGVLCVDLDGFKGVNDTLGHAVGDAVLKAVAKRLLDASDDSDIVARLGGDEFAVLQARIEKPEDAGILARRIVQAISEPFDVAGHRALIGASVGIAIGPVDGEHGDALMQHADLALYRAKDEGRNTYHFYEKSLDAALQERRSTETALRTALLGDELLLVFQPILNLTHKRVGSFEALLRWMHPRRGLLDPSEFISIAEETGLIIPIGEWVLHEACATAAKWPEHISVAVNLSAVQFGNRNLIQQVESALSAAGLKPRRLEVEITESVLLADSKIAQNTLRQLKQMGVKIAMDDFGTGYSSLSYLRSFPFDKIKIDQSFIRELSSKPDSVAIIKAVVDLSRSIGATTTAEGVETEDQFNIVREQGCTEVQGFLLSAPLPEAAVVEFLSRFEPAAHGRQLIKRSA
jgi:diguanylate cyclase (GGDEF)-like protein